MNEYDSERMIEALAPSGYEESQSEQGADLVILNTCHVREKATEKIYSELGRLKPLKLENPDLRIAVAGCVAQAEGQEIVRRQPMVDMVLGPQAYHRLPEMVAESGDGKSLALDFEQDEKFEALPRRRSNSKGVSAFLTVQEGCDKFCTFCVVPYTRGKEYSRPVDEVYAEAKALVEAGSREVILLGQNVNAYRDQRQKNGGWSLADLIWKLAEIPDLWRIRFVTSHPNDMSEDLNVAFRDCPKLMPYLHLPIQSGSDRILKLMNRKHTAAEYVDIIRTVRSYRPDIAVSGDFIVGFPGEEEEDFQRTLEIVKQVGFVKSFSFRYSPRPGTPAADRKLADGNQLKARLATLQRLLLEQQQMSLVNSVGKTSHVLFEKQGRHPGQLIGKNEHFQVVNAAAPTEMLGSMAEVKYTTANPNSLSGCVIN